MIRSRGLPFAVVLFLLALFAGCSRSSLQGELGIGIGTPCSTNADCPAGTSCDTAIGQCVVEDGGSDANCSANIESDPNNCGACGNVCSAATPFCLDGACQPPNQKVHRPAVRRSSRAARSAAPRRRATTTTAEAAASCARTEARAKTASAFRYRPPSAIFAPRATSAARGTASTRRVTSTTAEAAVCSARRGPPSARTERAAISRLARCRCATARPIKPAAPPDARPPTAIRTTAAAAASFARPAGPA